jgi:hypothetical protein
MTLHLERAVLERGTQGFDACWCGRQKNSIEVRATEELVKIMWRPRGSLAGYNGLMISWFEYGYNSRFSLITASEGRRLRG